MTESGLLCPKCNSGTKTHDSRPKPNGTTNRYRECLNCGFRFRTIEVVETDEMNPKYVRKKDMLKLRESGMTYDEIGKKYGISRQRVQQIIKKDVFLNE